MEAENTKFKIQKEKSTKVPFFERVTTVYFADFFKEVQITKMQEKWLISGVWVPRPNTNKIHFLTCLGVFILIKLRIAKKAERIAVLFIFRVKY